MRRRDFLRAAGASGLASGLCIRSGSYVLAAAQDRQAPLAIEPGPQLFLDDYLIEQMRGLRREVQHPQRLPEPILDSRRFGTTQPYLSVLRDPDDGRYRLWYNRSNPIWHVESDDAVGWRNPRVAWDMPRCFGCSLIDDRQRDPDPNRRFKMANWQATPSKERSEEDDSGMWIGFSPDGFHWTRSGRPVLPMWPEGYGKWVYHSVADIIDVFYDPVRKLYGAAVKQWATSEDGFATARPAGGVTRRLVAITTSEDFVHWKRIQRIIAPDEQDEGLIEFYGIGGIHFRGSLCIGLVRVLRDDLPCDPGGPAQGIGYTVLATSRDGVTWHRYREPFLDRNHQPGTWDHAMTWGSGVLHVGDELFVYYGGYARGHKIAPGSERQLGLARMKRDRYVAVVPTGQQGTLLTKPFVMPQGQMTVNIKAPDGQLWLRLLDPDSKPLDDVPPQMLTGDHLAAEVAWAKQPRGKAVRLEATLNNAAWFAFGFA